MTSLPVGSSAWTGGQEYEGEYAERISEFIERINQQAVLDYASELREQRPCTMSAEFSVGNDNLVRNIKFDDGVEWIARFRMPALSDGGSASTSRLEMQSELDTMEFVRRNTDIPVPKIYSYNLNEESVAGCPFSLMEYVHGNTAEDVSRSYPGDYEGILVQFQEKFWRQVAKTMIQLASVRMPKIGSIFRSSTDSETFIIGPLVETGSGPYSSSTELYSDYPLALDKRLRDTEDQTSGQEELVKAFQSTAKSFPAQSGSGFGLVNYDLNPNNFLVDSDFNVLAVIDWDSVVALPDAALYRFPFLMGVSCAVPGSVETHPAVLKREELGKQFAEVVETVSREQNTDTLKDTNKQPSFQFTKYGFYSKEALALGSLTFLKMRQHFVNTEWLQGLKWLSEHKEVEVAHFYHGKQPRTLYPQ